MSAVAGALLASGPVGSAAAQTLESSDDDVPLVVQSDPLTAATVESEPNDTRAGATSLPLGTAVGGELTEGDVDYFVFEGLGAEEYTFELARGRSRGAFTVVLYGPDGQFLDLLYMGSDKTIEASTVLEVSGEHYVQVVDVSGATGTYALRADGPELPSDAPAVESGSLWLEAESASAGDAFAPFVVESDGAASGSAYITTADEGRTHYGGAPSEGVAEYTFSVSEAGEYVLWGRGRGQSNGNSFYVAVDGGRTREWHLDVGGEWEWQTFFGAPVTLAAGEHTLRVSYREDGGALDRILVTSDADYVPAGVGETDSGTDSGTDPESGSDTDSGSTETPAVESGSLWLEAESASAGDAFAPFVVESDGAAAGGTCISTSSDQPNHYDGVPSEGVAEYTLSVPEDGEYVLWGRGRGRSNGNTFYVAVDGDRSDEWHLAVDGEWEWKPFFEAVSLSAGEHTLQVANRESGAALDRILVTSDADYVPTGVGESTTDTESGSDSGTDSGSETGSGSETDGDADADGQTPYGGEAHDVTGRVEAEHYDEGGEGVAYSDGDADNRKGALRSDGVDIQSSDDGGYNVGHIESGEWLEYTVAATPGTYDIKLRVASEYGGNRCRILLDGRSLGEVEVPATGGWHGWETVALHDVTVEADGESVLRLEAIHGGGDSQWLFNIDWISFVAADGSDGSTNPDDVSSAQPHVVRLVADEGVPTMDFRVEATGPIDLIESGTYSSDPSGTAYGETVRQLDSGNYVVEGGAGNGSGDSFSVTGTIVSIDPQDFPGTWYVDGAVVPVDDLVGTPLDELAPEQSIDSPLTGDPNIHVSFDSRSSMDPLGSNSQSGYIHNNFELTSAPGGRSGTVGEVSMLEGEHKGVSRHLTFGENGFADPEECWVRYYVYFDDAFEAVDGGGKFPGFSGLYGSDTFGGREKADGTNGWTARGGFRPVEDTWGDKWSSGNANPRTVPIELTFYTYHAKMSGSYGDNFGWNKQDADGNRPGWIDRGKWYCIDQYCRMNTPGRDDGVLRAWVDGGLALDKTNLRFRNSGYDDIKIESYWFNVYYGGGWASPNDNYVYFDDLSVRFDGPLSDDLERP